MDMKWKVLIVALIGAAVAFNFEAASPLGKAIWGEGSGDSPPDSQLPLFIVIGVLEALSFGAGIAFIAFGWSRVANAPGVSKGLATAGAAAIAWGLVSWIPHSAMHQTNGTSDWTRLLAIEYMFHVTLIAAAAILALYAYRVAGAGLVRKVPTEPRKPAVMTAMR